MKFRTSKLIVILAVLFLFFSTGYANTPDGELNINVHDHEAKISFQKIDENRILLSVLDTEDNPVKGLMTNDFMIEKGGIKANIVSAEILKTKKNIPINYVLVVDNSYSMKQRNAIEALWAALDELLKIVRPIDFVEVVVFDHKKSFVVDGHTLRLNSFRSNNFLELRNFFQKSFTQGLSNQTYLYEGIYGGMHLISEMPEESNKFLVVFTDGEDINSEINRELIAPKAKGLKNFQAYVIDFMPSENKNEFLNTFAENNGGKSWKAVSAANLLPIFQDISTTLLHQYVVEYNFIDPPQGTLNVTPSAVTIEELTIIDRSPLLNYIFFDTGQTAIPERYKLLENQSAAQAFNEKILRDTIAKYYNVLNIIGKRLSQDEQATIELVGCISDWGEEKNNLTLSRARSENVKSYLRYIWNISPDRIKVSARKLPELPSSNRIEQGRLENQRVEIHSDSPLILDSIKSTYTFEIADFTGINIQPDVQIGYDLKDWNIEIKGDEKVLERIDGLGNEIPEQSFSLVTYGLGKIGQFKNISTRLTMTDITGYTSTTPPATASVKYIKRVKSKTENLGYKVQEKYALILFDYDSSEIKQRNTTVINRVVNRIKELPSAKVTIVGQTDNIGKEDYNLALSLRRATAVYDHVMDSGSFSPEQISFRGDGPLNPPYDNATAEGRSLNRTVTITLEYEMN